MFVEIDTGSGFCFGVTRAIGKAEEELSRERKLYCLGDIVHNGREVERLRAMGLVTIDHEQFSRLHDASVLLRAHGEPPTTYLQAASNNINIIDATCPVVLHLQERIKREYDSDPEHSRQIVIYGKRGHAEVLGLVGQTEGTAIVIETPDEAAMLDFTRDIALYSQTTKSLDGFRQVVEYIREHIAPNATFTFYDTICRQVANRISHIREFASRHDIVLFVCGRKSSNGRALFEECRRANPHSFMIDSPDEIDSLQLDLSAAESIGICGATSTPKWLMEQCRDKF
ncbi:MAG: 4-hydroxy-3-methylbut-2-enyl diphosphate reductase [Bacteroidaceae bacterium]|nr:4-hydroxy-3-methylbut-2-enyl diphosphate reductase [Bacteroidaceae bacterium]